MKIILFFILAFMNIPAFTQDSWIIKLDKKQLLKTSEENTEKNQITLNRSQLKKKNLTVSYFEKEKLEGWRRTISVYDNKDNLLLQKQTGNLKLSEEVLKKWFNKFPVVMIYTWSLPIDPKMKATVRIRRVHLCTIHFK